MGVSLRLAEEWARWWARTGCAEREELRWAQAAAARATELDAGSRERLLRQLIHAIEVREDVLIVRPRLAGCLPWRRRP